MSAKLGLDNTTGSDDQTLIDSWCNEAVVDILLRTGCYVTSATLTETIGDGDYTLDPGVLLVKAWSWNAATVITSPEHITVEELARLRDAQSPNASPASFYAIAGSNLLLVYPTPATNDVITIYYVPRPTAMTAGTNDPSVATYGGIGTEFHKAIEYYALWQGADYADDSGSGQGQQYMLLYQGADGTGGELAKIRSAINRKAGKPAGFTIPSMRRKRRYSLLKPGQRDA